MKYTQQDLESMLDDFRGLPAETAWLEFKENMADPVRIAKYISALSNMAAYYGRNAGYLVWGVDDATHEIKGTDFDKDVVKAGVHQDQPLELWLRLVIKPQTSYEFFPFESDGKKIVILEVDAAYRQPVTYQGQGWARIGNALTEMSKDPKIAAATNQRAEYIKTRAANDNNFRRMILDYLAQWKSASREDINKLLLDKLPKGMSVEQGVVKISTLLTSLRRTGHIVNIGSCKKSKWVLC